MCLLFTGTGLGLSAIAAIKRSKALLFFIGMAGALLALTKINVGLFFLAAVFFSIVCLMRRGTLRSLLLGAGSIAAIMLPAVLMRLHLMVWAKHYCELATASIALFVWTASELEPEDLWRPKDLLFSSGGVLAGAALVLGIALTQGISAASLLDGRWILQA